VAVIEIDSTKIATSEHVANSVSEAGANAAGKLVRLPLCVVGFDDASACWIGIGRNLGIAIFPSAMIGCE
jgi:hypothetical protein